MKKIIPVYAFIIFVAASCSAQPGQEPVAPSMAGRVQKVVIMDTSGASPGLDTMAYNRQLAHLVHGQPAGGWPVKAPFPPPGAILPFTRVLAYYGNLYSTKMGILGALPEEEMLERLSIEAANWARADTSMPVQKALHYIAVTAQSTPGAGGKYRLRMPAAQIEKVLALAQKAGAIVFLDIQVGWSSLQEEIPQLEEYLKLPFVHLGIDPEYSMKGRQVPCTAIGTFDAADINYASSYLAGIVKQYGLPPKILVVHRFTQAMVTNYKNIVLRPEVQIVMNMDGFGSPAQKRDSYKSWISRQPVQFTGFKLFYKNDPATGGRLMQPEEVLQLFPSPVYIQYQ